MANETKVKKNRINMVQLFKEVAGEVKKLAWSSKKELASYVLTVLGFIVLMAVVIYVLDLVFGEGLALFARL